METTIEDKVKKEKSFDEKRLELVQKLKYEQHKKELIDFAQKIKNAYIELSNWIDHFKKETEQEEVNNIVKEYINLSGLVVQSLEKPFDSYFTYFDKLLKISTFDQDYDVVLKEKIKDGYNEEMFYGIVKKSLECYEYSIAETISKLYNKFNYSSKRTKNAASKKYFFMVSEDISKSVLDKIDCEIYSEKTDKSREVGLRDFGCRNKITKEIIVECEKDLTTESELNV